MFRFASSIITVILVSLLQTSNIFILGVKPNLPLVCLIILSLINKSWVERLILIFLSIVLLNFYPPSISNLTLDFPMIFFTVITILAILAMDFMPWAHLLNLIIVVAFASILLNIYNFDLRVVILESSYNMILALIIFTLIPSTYVEQEIQRNKFR